MAFGFFMKKRPSTKTAAVRDREPEKQKPISPPTPIIVPVEPGKQVYAFIDASNLFWGGRESIGFKISYAKLLHLLKERYNVSRAFYYGGIRIFDFDFSILDNKVLDLAKLFDYLTGLQKKTEPAEAELVAKSLNKLHFYQLLESYGYTMKIKPAKVFYDEDDENHERPILKANCDVDMTFDMMRYMGQYSGVVAMTGDGDFASILSYLKGQGRIVTVVSRWERTAKEIHQLAGDNFVDLARLERQIRY